METILLNLFECLSLPFVNQTLVIKALYVSFAARRLFGSKMSNFECFYKITDRLIVSWP